jgi:RNA polymerase sigma-70 factor (ECF subfamily)
VKLQPPSETDLLSRAHQLDSSTLAQIYDLYSTDIYRYALRLLGNSGLAEECVAETFSRLLHAFSSGKGPRDFLRAYLYRIAHNWITDQYRRERPIEVLDESLPGEDNSPEEIADHHAQQMRLRQAIRRLTPEQQQVVALKFWQDCDNEEIARILGKPVGAIKSLQHRAFANLQRSLQETERNE